MSHSRKGPGSMNVFVRGKNPHRDDIERLKVDVPQMASASINNPLASQGGEQSDHKTRTEDAWQDQLRTSDTTNPFYGTDASNADDTSIASSAKDAFPALPDAQRPHSGSNGHIIGEGPASSEDYGDNESDSDVSLDPIEQHTNYNVSQRPNTHDPNFMSAMGKMETGVRQGKGGKSLTTKYVAGDSYPSTTSGRLSLSNSDESSRNTSRRQFQTSGPSLHHQRSLHQPIQSNGAINGGSNDDGLFLNPAHNESLFEAPKFRYDKGPAPRSMKPQRHYMQPNPQSQSIRPAEVTHLAQRPSTAGGHMQFNPQSHASDFFQPTQPQHQQHTSSLTRGDKAILPLDENVQGHWPGPPDHGIPQKVAERHYGMGAHFKSTQPSGPELAQQMGLGKEEPDLDYEPQELRSMNYQTLKGTAFDFEPYSSRFTLPNAQPTDDLTQKLFAASELNRPEQAKFFASLTIDDWEQAGDWFLDRFGDVMKRLKEARQEKREAAKRFEDEVEHRHDAVSKKRKLTDDALSEMKTSGALVLQGTPRKGRSDA
ncbi:hypothetical protein KC367_g2090 [Hortaea werneckii]|uniref:Extracellular mutant protein 11 C-terminal domain-containing protein n=2 Tax=Hortaea werneckii TaxID=91943 RepID=A0A3M7I4F6_HORWE|nr:hypothetical protein KC358_g14617 [Hortaea werneckii]KAI6805808.1 hypothetical protein KC350_g14434 [Hortaea werneckii]KAI6906095.1 hypothetical protein KC348_g14773 [Hortaea werneckii]KAI6923829.1 hypothetical protein KC341_g14457 [Hortaea werneckii]KAI6957199.1 hypothetical protein KC321_g14723 [Hortaea werneckii]